MTPNDINQMILFVTSELSILKPSRKFKFAKSAKENVRSYFAVFTSFLPGLASGLGCYFSQKYGHQKATSDATYHVTFLVGTFLEKRVNYSHGFLSVFFFDTPEETKIVLQVLQNFLESN